jgi:hypothetical protein
LTKVDSNAPKRQKILSDGPFSHLDLIKRGNFQLKKVDHFQTLQPRSLSQLEQDASQLTMGEFLQKTVSIREAVTDNESDTAGDELECSSTAW